MDQVKELLSDLLEREDVALEVEVHETAQHLRASKLEATHIEQMLQARKKMNHNLLKERVAAVDQRLEQRRRMADSPNQRVSRRQSRNSSFDQNSNYAASSGGGKTSTELMDSFSKLGDLQNQQKTLEDWYGSMSEQLQQEQLRLTLKFNEMKMKILERKKVYLHASQECIDNLSLKSQSPQIHRRTSVSPNMQKRNSSSRAFSLAFSQDASVQDYEADKHRRRSEMMQNREQTEKDFALNDSESELYDTLPSESSSVQDEGSLAERTRGISPIRSRGYSVSDERSSRSNSVRRDSSRSNSIRKGLFNRYVTEMVSDRRTLLPFRRRRLSSQTASRSNESLEDVEGYERAEALVRGYFTRKLMQTDKVQELIKEIKDTKAVLRDLHREERKKQHLNKPDQLLKDTLEPELENAKARLKAILMTSSTEEKMKLIAHTKLAAKERYEREFFRNTKAPKHPIKKLSTVTQQIINKKKHAVGVYPFPEYVPSSRPHSALSVASSRDSRGTPSPSRPHVPSARPHSALSVASSRDSRGTPSPARPHSALSVARSQDSRGTRSSLDVRSLRPTASEHSPRYNPRAKASKDRRTAGQPQPKPLRRAPARKVSKKPSIAANLNRLKKSPRG